MSGKRLYNTTKIFKYSRASLPIALRSKCHAVVFLETANFYLKMAIISRQVNKGISKILGN